MLIGQHCSCILNRCAFWSTPILHETQTVSSVSLICSVYLFLVWLCLISSNNQEILSLLIVVLCGNWTLDYLIGFLELTEELWQRAQLLWREFDQSKTGQTSLQRFVSALEEIMRICEEYACDSVKSCSCRGAGAPLDRGERTQWSQFISHLSLSFSSLSDLWFSVFVSQCAKQVHPT